MVLLDLQQNFQRQPSRNRKFRSFAASPRCIVAKIVKNCCAVSAVIFILQSADATPIDITLLPSIVATEFSIDFPVDNELTNTNLDLPKGGTVFWIISDSPDSEDAVPELNKIFTISFLINDPIFWPNNKLWPTQQFDLNSPTYASGSHSVYRMHMNSGTLRGPVAVPVPPTLYLIIAPVFLLLLKRREQAFLIVNKGTDLAVLLGRRSSYQCR